MKILLADLDLLHERNRTDGQIHVAFFSCEQA